MKPALPTLSTKLAAAMAATVTTVALLAVSALTAPVVQAQEDAPPPPDKAVARERPPLPDVDLTPELMQKLMLAEIALQRGRPEQGVHALLDIARDTHDPRVAERATQAAIGAGMMREALEASGLWIKADPGSPQARLRVVQLLVRQQNLADAREPLARWLAADKEAVAQDFPQLTLLFSRHPDKKGVYDLLRSVAGPYDKLPEVRLALAQAAWSAKDVDASLAEARAALELRPDSEVAALYEAQALQKKSSTEAIPFLAQFLDKYPNARDARMGYARLLAQNKRQADARAQFDRLLADSPKNAELAMTVGLLAVQLEDYDAAEKYFKAALAAGHKEPDAIWMMLGQINEERKNYDEALKWYGGVGPGERFLMAQARYAGVLAKQGKLDEARKHLHEVTPRDDGQRVQLVQAEANLLREAQDYQGAYDLLGKSIAADPASVDLLYDQAMIAEKMDRLDVMESNLRKVIQLQPDHAHAHNALGYTLADRNERLPEARQLIERALELAPQDGYIMDSLGWVLYRQGHNDDAITQLQRAYQLRPEPDVGAHLGEVLWMNGQRDEARKIWGEMLKEDAANDTLVSTLKRLAPAMLSAGQ